MAYNSIWRGGGARVGTHPPGNIFSLCGVGHFLLMRVLFLYVGGLFTMWGGALFSLWGPFSLLMEACFTMWGPFWACTPPTNISASAHDILMCYKKHDKHKPPAPKIQSIEKAMNESI